MGFFSQYVAARFKGRVDGGRRLGRFHRNQRQGRLDRLEHFRRIPVDARKLIAQGLFGRFCGRPARVGQGDARRLVRVAQSLEIGRLVSALLVGDDPDLDPLGHVGRSFQSFNSKAIQAPSLLTIRD